MSKIELELEKTSNLYFYKLGEGTPLLLIHGNGFDSLVWSKTAHFLAQNHTVYVVDRNGFGKSMSKKSDIKNYNKVQAIDILFFIKNKIKEQTILVGWSSGALLAFHAVLMDTESWIKQLISFDAPYLTSSNSDFKSMNQFIKIIGYQIIGKKEKAAEIFMRLVLQKEHLGNSFDDLDIEMQASFRRNIEATLNEIKTRTGEDLDGQKLKTLKIPIALIKSELSPPFLQAAYERLKSIFPHAQLAEIKDAGRFALYEKSKEIADIIHNSMLIMN